MLDDPWLVPPAPDGVHGTIRVPGSKSVTNRALLLALLADGSSRIRQPLAARDTVLMVGAVRALGADVTGGRAGFEVRPPTTLRGGVSVDCGLAGTVMRFVPPVAALAGGTVRFDGDPRARVRPMGQTISTLRDLGVTVEDGGRGTLPFTVRGFGAVGGGAVTVDASGSSQFLSALLLAAPRYRDGLRITLAGRLPSRHHVSMTVAMLRARGVTVETDPPGTDPAGAAAAPGTVWQVHPGPISGGETVVEPDLSTAAPFLAAAALAGGEVVVLDWPADTDQPGGLLLDVLREMGAEVTTTAEGVTVRGTGALRGLDVDLGDAPELVPVVAALAAAAGSASRIRGVAHVRGQESDRLAALVSQIGGLGGDVTETDDGLAIGPAPLAAPAGFVFETFADHRIAHAGALLGLVVPGLAVGDIATTAKTYPEFPAVFAGLVDSRSASTTR